MARKRPSWLKKWNQTPPWAVRAAAVRKWHGRESKKIRRLTLSELVKRSGIPARSFQRISSMLNWNSVKAEDIERFTTACGINLDDKRPFEKFLKGKYNPDMSYFTKAQRSFFDRKSTEYASKAD